MMMMTEAASPAAGGIIASTPTAHYHQRTSGTAAAKAAAETAAAATTSMMTMMMMAGHGHAHAHGGAPSHLPPTLLPHSAATGSVLDRSHSYTEAMLMETLDDGTSGESCHPRDRLSATLSDVLQSLSKLSTDGAVGGATTYEDQGVVDSVNDDFNPRGSGSGSSILSMSSSCNGDSRRGSVDASAMIVPPSSFRTPEMQRSTVNLPGLHHAALLHHPPTHKREHSSSSMGYGCGSYNWSCATNLPVPPPPPSYPSYQSHTASRPHPPNSSCPSGAFVGSASKKSRTGSFVLLQSAPHLPLSPELDATAAIHSFSEANLTSRAVATATTASASGLTSAKLTPSGSETEEGPAPMVWKSHIRLPPPLFSPVLHHHQYAAPGAATPPASASSANLGMTQPTLPQCRFLIGPAHPVLTMTDNHPPPLQPDLPSFDEHAIATHPPANDANDAVGEGRGTSVLGPVVRLQQRRCGALLPSHLLPALSSMAGAAEPEGSSSDLILPPPMPLISSPTPSPTVGPRRTLRMRKADSMDLVLP